MFYLLRFFYIIMAESVDGDEIPTAKYLDDNGEKKTYLDTKEWNIFDFYTLGAEFGRRNLAWFQYLFPQCRVCFDEHRIYLQSITDQRTVYIDRPSLVVMTLVCFCYNSDSGASEDVASTSLLIHAIQQFMALLILPRPRPRPRTSLFYFATTTVAAADYSLETDLVRCCHIADI